MGLSPSPSLWSLKWKKILKKKSMGILEGNVWKSIVMIVEQIYEYTKNQWIVWITISNEWITYIH